MKFFHFLGFLALLADGGVVRAADAPVPPAPQSPVPGPDTGSAANSAPITVASTAILPPPISSPYGLAVDKDDNVFVSDVQRKLIYRITAKGELTVVAGILGQTGAMNGKGTEATFAWPSGLAVDKVGNLYVSDSMNDSIRKISVAGLVTTLAGKPGERNTLDGKGGAAHFNTPTDLAVDNNGNVYVCDNGGSVIRKVTPDGSVAILAGKTGEAGSIDGRGAAVRFGKPRGVAVDAGGKIYIADESYHTIRMLAPDGLVTTLAGNPNLDAGNQDGVGTAAYFAAPRALAVDAKGNVYVADTENQTIRKITPNGLVTTLAGKAGLAGAVDGKGDEARFNMPRGVAVDKEGNIYVADSMNAAIRKITPDGVVSTLLVTPLK